MHWFHDNYDLATFHLTKKLEPLKYIKNIK